MKNNPTPHPPEEWRAIPGFPGYRISSLGSVFSHKTHRELSARPNKGGYRHVSLRRDSQSHPRYVHQLVALSFIGPRPDGAEIRHLDGDRANNTVTNLVYGTAAENAQDRVRHGRDQNGRKTECHNGHPFDERNTRVNPNGSRSCRACGRDTRRAYVQRQALRAAGIQVAA